MHQESLIRGEHHLHTGNHPAALLHDKAYLGKTRKEGSLPGVSGEFLGAVSRAQGGQLAAYLLQSAQQRAALAADVAAHRALTRRRAARWARGGQRAAHGPWHAQSSRQTAAAASAE